MASPIRSFGRNIATKAKSAASTVGSKATSAKNTISAKATAAKDKVAARYADNGLLQGSKDAAVFSTVTAAAYAGQKAIRNGAHKEAIPTIKKIAQEIGERLSKIKLFAKSAGETPTAS